MADDHAKRHSLDDLLKVMARLRDPGSGCPWDLEQSFATIAPYTIEEAYEVADAISRDDMDALKEELGDLLLQVVYHAQLASEQSRFDFADVADAITSKMIRRHPHVFKDPGLRDEFLSSDLWQRIKDEEKSEHGGERQGSRLLDVPLPLPALTRAVKLQKRAAEVGFDWPSLALVLAKAEEEIAELKAAIDETPKGAQTKPTKRVAEEFGDLLFVMANLARHLGVDPEAALRDANAKFVRRFQSIETALAAEGRRPEDSSLEEMDQLWDEAKAAEPKD
ncbi:MAG: nucleoside triphosphate pyrophosphohydrolase [Methyloceanibacter sp.]|uniref:nucleoside triphosphate pyrophosphohydrolase n=1 Tax=Methyloceanibacter sp. TaxID=1965321 RepID=UPI003D9BF255